MARNSEYIDVPVQCTSTTHVPFHTPCVWSFMERKLQTTEAALADEWVKNGDRLELQQRAIRLSKQLKQWKVYPWEEAATWQPTEVTVTAQPLPNILVYHVLPAPSTSLVRAGGS